MRHGLCEAISPHLSHIASPNPSQHLLVITTMHIEMLQVRIASSVATYLSY